MRPFSMNVLDKRQTFTEKLVSLIRFSLSDKYMYDMAAKIRHFYDLHYLLQDKDCVVYLHSEQFCQDFENLLQHDKETFDKPEGLTEKHLGQSPLLVDFPTIWSELKNTYVRELPGIAFSAIPKETVVAHSFMDIVEIFKHNYF